MKYIYLVILGATLVSIFYVSKDRGSGRQLKSMQMEYCQIKCQEIWHTDAEHAGISSCYCK